MRTAEDHRQFAELTARRTIELLADVHGPAREYQLEHPQFTPSLDADNAFTIGYLTATVEGLLDVLGYPKQGPNIDQRSWLPDLDNDDDDESDDVDDNLNTQEF